MDCNSVDAFGRELQTPNRCVTGTCKSGLFIQICPIELGPGQEGVTFAHLVLRSSVVPLLECNEPPHVAPHRALA
eukprot:scaffold8243_cov129-Isochrysis_galbana.AAC.11